LAIAARDSRGGAFAEECATVGMTVGESKGVVADPNIVPLIDVLLVLIIIFMVMPSRTTGLPALVPQPAPPEARIEGPIVVQVLRGGKLTINEEPSDWDSLGAKLSEIFKQRADKVAFVKGDEEVPFEQVARAIDIMRGAGIEHVGLITGGGDVPAKRL
jgi:biopolymer transport protein TolR